MSASAGAPASPYDALLILSFGGPEGPEDVLPFLRNVTSGRGIPDDRLQAVAQHYQGFGGVSPINAQNRALVAAVEAELAERQVDLPVYWGNRNWAPYLADTFAVMRADGVRRVAVFVTAAYASYSGCRQYREDLAAAVEAAGAASIQVDKLRHYFNHPGFVEPSVDAVVDALAALPEEARRNAHLAFVTHSVPTEMAVSSGPDGDAYVRQHGEVAALVAAGVAARTGAEHAWDLVYCSRSGPPAQPWLEPDINDHLEALAAAGVPAVVVVPIGFVSDHMEVKYDLDTEAAQTAAARDLPVHRAATAGVAPRFVAMVVDLLLERARAETGPQPERPCVGSFGPSHDICPVGCCPNLRTAKAALAGADSPRLVTGRS